MWKYWRYIKFGDLAIGAEIAKIKRFLVLSQYIRPTHRKKSPNLEVSCIVAHDELCNRKRAIQDEDRRGVLSKPKGQLARLAMILHVLQMALLGAPEWDPMVTKEDADCAKVIDFIIE